MNIVYYSSDLFAEMCGVSIQSLCVNNMQIDSIRIFIVEDHISDENKDKIRRLVGKFGREVVFIPMLAQEKMYPGIKINLGRTYSRMTLGEILPNDVDRVISVDSDTLILDSLEEMYNVEFEEDEYVAGVYDCVGAAIQNKVLHSPKDILYCNAGVFLFDLKKWRERSIDKDLLEAVLKYSNKKHIMFFLEQDIMNIVFYKHMKLLHPRYNMLTSIYIFDYDDIIGMKKPVLYYTKEQIIEAKSNPAILHATTCFYVRKRMWVMDSDHPYASIYNKYRNETPWKYEKSICDNRKITKKIYAGLWHLMPKRFSILVAGFLINYVRPVYAWITTKASITTIAKQSSY